MNENLIAILVRGTKEDIQNLNDCLESLNSKLKNTLKNADLVLFHEADFSHLKPLIKIPKAEYFPTIFYVQLDLSVPKGYPEEIVTKIEDFYPHPTNQSHVGFSIGYRSMCRFFSGVIFADPFVQRYKYLMRLDTDSLFLDGSEKSLFHWMEEEEIVYSYIQSAIQWDHPDVTRYFKRSTIKIFAKMKFGFLLKSLIQPKDRMFYTNFEIMKVSFFASKNWQRYFHEIDRLGGFYLHRWGDAIVRYVGVNVLTSRKNRKPIPAGFVYKHGGTFQSGARLSKRNYILKNLNRLG